MKSDFEIGSMNRWMMYLQIFSTLRIFFHKSKYNKTGFKPVSGLLKVEYYKVCAKIDKNRIEFKKLTETAICYNRGFFVGFV